MGKKEKEVENNQVCVQGEVVSGFTFSHEIFGEGFYVVDLSVKRLSDSIDIIPIMVSDRLVDIKEDFMGQLLSVTGQFRSYNRHEEKKNRLILSVFAREVSVLTDEDEMSDINKIFLDGYICKEPVYRKTPLGREIGDLLLAVNRPYGKSDYIPCIAWGRNARFISNLSVGDRLQVSGRIQSREYMKKIGPNDDDVEKRVAYEVSVSRIDLAEENGELEED